MSLFEAKGWILKLKLSLPLTPWELCWEPLVLACCCHLVIITVHGQCEIGMSPIQLIVIVQFVSESFQLCHVVIVWIVVTACEWHNKGFLRPNTLSLIQNWSLCLFLFCLTSQCANLVQILHFLSFFGQKKPCLQQMRILLYVWPITWN